MPARLRPTTLTVTLLTLSVAATATYLVGPTASAAPAASRLLPGSADYKDPNGATWAADTTCSGGKVGSTRHSIAGTSVPVLYQRERSGVTSCALPVDPGATYDVTLYLAETAPRTTRRVFDVLADGAVAVPRLDIAALAGGPYRATQVSFEVQAARSTVMLAFRRVSGSTKVSAVRVAEVRPAPAAPAPTPSPSASPTPTVAPSPSASPTPMVMPSPSPSPTPTPTATAAPSPTPSPTPSYALDPSFDRPSKSDPADYRQHVDFNVQCKVASLSSDDPIVHPGMSGMAHRHVFAGNTTTDAMSTQQSLDAGGSTCQLAQDRAAYWFPQLIDSAGTPQVPYLVRAYYRVGTLGTVSTIPHGLKVIAGDAAATGPQDYHLAGWQCRSVSPDLQTVKKQAAIPTCPSSDLLEGSVVFPNCWDGVNLDSPDHKSHMAYGQGDSCDAAHPVRLPALTIAFRYRPGTTSSSSVLAGSGNPWSLHADFWNAWDPATLQALVDRCLNDGVHCGDVSPTHFPGPMP